MVLRFLLVCSALFQPYLLYALTPNWNIPEYMQRTLRSQDGLLEDSVYSVAQSKDGYLWIGTSAGVVRYDGVRFVPLDPPAGSSLRNINSLLTDSRGSLWIGGISGLWRKDGDHVTTFTRKDGFKEDPWIYSMQEDRTGAVWFGTHAGLVYWKEGIFHVLSEQDGLPSKYVHAVNCDSDGSVWAGTQDGLAIWKDGKFKVYTTADGLPNNAVWGILEENHSHWIATEGGLSQFKDGHFQNFTSADGLPSDLVNALARDRDGNLWIGTESGLCRLRDKKIEKYSLKSGIYQNAVWTLFEDYEGSLWIGMDNGGVTRLSEGKFRVIGKDSSLNSDIVSSIVEADDKVLWVGTDEGLNRLDHDGEKIPSNEQLLNEYVTVVFQDSRKDMWIGTKSGVKHISNGKMNSYSTKDGMTDNIPLVFHEDRQAILWIGTNLGLNVWKDGKVLPVKEFPLVSIYAICDSPDAGILIATRDGLYSFRNGVPKLIKEAEGEGLNTSFVSSLYNDTQGNVWIGTLDTGLVLYRNGKFYPFRSHDGLASDSISTIMEDDSSHLWLGTNNGISRVEKAGLLNFANGKEMRLKISNYGLGDGMRTLECYYEAQPSSCKTRDGRLWFPTTQGIAVIDPAQIRLNKQAPTVVIEELDLGEKSIVHKGDIDLEPGSGNFEFRYTAFSFIAPEKVLFRYRLNGFDSEWTEGGNRRSTRYTNIPPGKYTFEVIACNNDGVWSPVPATLGLYLRPHYYQTWWFYGLCACTLSFLIWQFHRYRVRRVLEIEKIRTHIATDLHDDIGAGLSQIAILTEVSRRNLHQSDAGVDEKLGKVSGTARELAESMSDIVWAVNPARDHLEDLVHRMRKFANDMLASKEIEVEFESMNLDADRKLSPDFRRNLYLIFKESIHNIAKHSGAKNVKIQFRGERNGMALLIQDDGKGFDAAAAYSGNGVRNIRRRAEQLGGNVAMESSAEHGTSIRCNVPFSGAKKRMTS